MAWGLRPTKPPFGAVFFRAAPAAASQGDRVPAVAVVGARGA